MRRWRKRKSWLVVASLLLLIGVLALSKLSMTGPKVELAGKSPTADRLLSEEKENVEENTPLRWYALGDSITEGWISDQNADGSWRSLRAPNYGWVTKVTEEYGYDTTNLGTGGMGYVCGKSNARVTADGVDFSECDFVTLAYGVNDWKYVAPLGSMEEDVTSGNSMVANMRYVIEKIQKDNPSCKIIVITPLNCWSLGYYETNWGLNYEGTYASGPGLEQIFQLQKQICEYYSLEMIDMTHTTLVTNDNIKTLFPDRIHPTKELNELLAEELGKRIEQIVS